MKRMPPMQVSREIPMMSLLGNPLGTGNYNCYTHQHWLCDIDFLWFWLQITVAKELLSLGGSLYANKAQIILVYLMLNKIYIETETYW